MTRVQPFNSKNEPHYYDNDSAARELRFLSTADSQVPATKQNARTARN